jgi:hypothetical protein
MCSIAAPLAALLAGIAIPSPPIAAAAEVSGKAAPTLILPDDRGGACVIFITHDPHNVSCASPGARGYRIVGVPAGKKEEDVLQVADVGDVNGDGIDDFAVGVPWAEFDGRLRAGITYIVFGSSTATEVDLQNLGVRGFRIGGAVAGDQTTTLEANELYGDRGDVNGDGHEDIIVESDKASTLSRKHNGSAWIVFGKSDGADVDLAALGTGGFRIDGATSEESIGNALIVGDVNGDGKADIAIDENPAEIVFGKSDPADIDLGSSAVPGFAISGLVPVNDTESAVADVGDVNGDGIDDLLVGRYDLAKPRAYIVFGHRGISSFGLNRLGSKGITIKAPYPSLANFGEGAGLGRLTAAGTPLVGLTDPRDIYVLKLPRHGGVLDLRPKHLPGYRIVYPQRAQQGSPITPRVIGLGSTDSDTANGDMLVEWWNFRHQFTQTFVVFGRPPRPGTVDLRHLGDRGFQVLHVQLGG